MMLVDAKRTRILNLFSHERIANNVPYPYLVMHGGDILISRVFEPLSNHFLVHVDNEQNKYVITKGNGSVHCPYQTNGDILTEDTEILSEDYLQRVYNMCLLIQDLGIKTCQMEYIMELDYPIRDLNHNTILHPFILQYSVECPYLIYESNINTQGISIGIATWRTRETYQDYQIPAYFNVADILFSNLCKMHRNNITHGSISATSYTWALELLNFDTCRKQDVPFDENNISEPYRKDIDDTYTLIEIIANCLGEIVSWDKLDEIYAEKKRTILHANNAQA